MFGDFNALIEQLKDIIIDLCLLRLDIRLFVISSLYCFHLPLSVVHLLSKTVYCLKMHDYILYMSSCKVNVRHMCHFMCCLRLEKNVF